MRRSFFGSLILCLFFVAISCETPQVDSNKTPEQPESKNSNAAAPEKVTKKPKNDVNVPKLANKSASEFDRVFGPPDKITKITDNPKFMPGEYRQYRVGGHPKGLSVRFYRNKAKRFNLLLGKPERNPDKALSRIFKIEVRGMKPVKGDPLSKTWRGKSGNINFKTAYAKRDKPGGNFVMLHAEVVAGDR